MDAAQLIDPQRTRLRIDGRRGLVFDLDQCRNIHTIPHGQDGWRALGESIGGHENLLTLDFMSINSTPENLEALLMGVSHNRSVSELRFRGFYGDWPLEILATFFENNQNLRKLGVLNNAPSHESIRSLSTVIGSCATCSLEEIDWYQSPAFSWSPAGDAIISEFIASLTGLSRLKTLQLRGSNIGRRVCDAMAALLRNQSCTLQTINLTGNNIGDEGLAAFESAVAVNSTLKKLILPHIYDVTPAAWISFVSVLRSPTCILEELDLDCNIINDDVMVAFADALSGNNTLKQIRFSQGISISNIGWSSISRSLFDNSSIINMYNSNHTLSRIYGPKLPGDLQSYLQLNKDGDKRAVARQKILMHFFGGDYDMEPFNENNMDSKVLPHLLNWIGKVSDFADEEDVSYSEAVEEDSAEEDASYSDATEEDATVTSFTAMFGFLRRVPALCENCGVEAQHQEAEG